MRDRKWNFPRCFCIIRDGKCQKLGIKITFRGDEKKSENREGIRYRRKENSVITDVILLLILKKLLMKGEAKLYLRSDLSNHCACTPVNYGPYPFFLACVYTQAADALESSGDREKRRER